MHTSTPPARRMDAILGLYLLLFYLYAFLFYTARTLSGRAAWLGTGATLARFGGCRDARSAGRRLLGRQPAD